MGVSVFSTGYLPGAVSKSVDAPLTFAADAPASSSPQASSAPKKGGSGGLKVVKVVPDQKAYVGSPPTRLNVAEIFAHTDIAGDGDHLIIEVISNTKDKKDKYVAASIEGHELVLEWKEVGKTNIRLRVTNERTGESVDCQFVAILWVADYWKLMFTVIGGLGLFLLGMKSMSDGLQAIAGAGLRRMIALVTKNRMMAVSAGALATMVVQSSSITTVMVVGFVNSGFMHLTQAIGVIMGANIGTTITGWILVLEIGKYGLPIIGVGVFGYLFSKNDRLRFIAMFAMGLGMVFFGLEVMKNGFSMVKDLPAFESWFNTFNAGTYWGVLKCASVGCILTFVVQSSSATLGITIGLSQVGVIQFETAAALVLGENIGTTITAWLASFGATTNAKRAAYFHVTFNLIGVLTITAIFWLYLPIVEAIVETIWGLDSTTGKIDPTKGIATAHSCFNITNTIMFLPLIGLASKLLTRAIPEKAHKETPHLTRLDVRILETPAIAIEQSRLEIIRMAEGCGKMMQWLKELLQQDEPDSKLVQKLFHREEVLDTVQDEIVVFMTNLLSGNVPHTIVAEGRCQLRMTDEYESVSDYIASILKFHLKLRNQGHRFNQKDLGDILKLHDMVDDYLQLVYRGVHDRHPEVITKANSMGAEVTRLAKTLRDDHLESLTEEKMPPFINLAYTSTLNSYRRVRDHAKNIAEALAGEK